MHDDAPVNLLFWAQVIGCSLYVVTSLTKANTRSMECFWHWLQSSHHDNVENGKSCIPVYTPRSAFYGSSDNWTNPWVWSEKQRKIMPQPSISSLGPISFFFLMTWSFRTPRQPFFATLSTLLALCFYPMCHPSYMYSALVVPRLQWKQTKNCIMRRWWSSQISTI